MIAERSCATKRIRRPMSGVEESEVVVLPCERLMLAQVPGFS